MRAPTEKIESVSSTQPVEIEPRITPENGLLRKYCIVGVQNLLGAAENNTITFEQFNSFFRTREEKAIANEFLKEIGKKSGTLITTKKGFQVLRPREITNIVIPKGEIEGFKPIPLGSKEYVKYVVEMKKSLAFGETPLISRNDYINFFREKFGDKAEEVARVVEERLIEEGYVKPIKFGFLLKPTIKELEESLE